MSFEMLVAPFLLVAVVIGSPYRPLPDDKAASATSIPAKADCNRKDRKMIAPPTSGEGVADLPFAFGKRFETLDAYLSHLECFAGPIDLPWWKEIAPDTFRLMTTGTAAKEEVATRKELQKRFGFHR